MIGRVRSTIVTFSCDSRQSWYSHGRHGTRIVIIANPGSVRDSSYTQTYAYYRICLRMWNRKFHEKLPIKTQSRETKYVDFVPLYNICLIIVAYVSYWIWKSFHINTSQNRLAPSDTWRHKSKKKKSLIVSGRFRWYARGHIDLTRNEYNIESSTRLIYGLVEQ